MPPPVRSPGTPWPAPRVRAGLRSAPRGAGVRAGLPQGRGLPSGLSRPPGPAGPRVSCWSGRWLRAAPLIPRNFIKTPTPRELPR